MPPILTAFANSPDRGRGLARDMRVRWALEEVGQPYEVRLLSFAELKQPAHLARHPFGQIPTYEDGDMVLFESGAIVLHLAITQLDSEDGGGARNAGAAVVGHGGSALRGGSPDPERTSLALSTLRERGPSPSPADDEAMTTSKHNVPSRRVDDAPPSTIAKHRHQNRSKESAGDQSHRPPDQELLSSPPPPTTHANGDNAAQRRSHLLPTAPEARQRAIAWMFAALNTVEPPIVERSMAFLFEREQPWYAARGEMLDARVHQRLGELSRHLGPRAWLEDDFSAGDLLMVSVLLRLQGAGFIEGYPNLVDYIARASARPAYQRAFEAQRQVFMQAQEGHHA